jgi:hypothetical protein
MEPFQSLASVYKSLKNLEHIATWRCVRNTNSCFDRSPHLTNVPDVPDGRTDGPTDRPTDRRTDRPTDRRTDGRTDTRSRSRQYIDRAKDWVEWTLEKPPRVKNSVLPRCARQQKKVTLRF